MQADVDRLFQIGRVFYRVSIDSIGESRLLYITHYYLDYISEDGRDVRFRELVRMDSDWRISPTDTVFGEGTREDALKFLVTRDGLSAKIAETSQQLENALQQP